MSESSKYEPRVCEYDSGGNYVGAGNGRAAWYRASAFEHKMPADLPDDLFDALAGLGENKPEFRISPVWFPSRAAAVAALEAAITKAGGTCSAAGVLARAVSESKMRGRGEEPKPTEGE